MKIKKIILIILFIICIAGCTNVKSLNYDDIIDTFNTKPKNPNVYKKGYQYYVPRGLIVDNAGSNYAILTSEDTTYYLYVDLVSYINGKNIDYETKKDLVFSQKLNFNQKSGYVEIKLWENNQYLIEIMYNYAKIEVMVEEDLINKALINSINILNNIKYNDKIIEILLSDDELSNTEEIFEMFEDDLSNNNSLKKEEEKIEEDIKEEIKDTDFIN